MKMSILVNINFIKYDFVNIEFHYFEKLLRKKIQQIKYMWFEICVEK